MHRQKRNVMHVLLISTIVPLISLCATFIALYLFMPAQHTTPPLEFTTVSVAPPVRDTAVVPVSNPVQIKIASIKVSAQIKPVGLTQAGDMDIDDNPEEAAWYKLGPKPGEEGSAVIAGHYGWKAGVPSVFNDLHTLVKGDVITTIDEAGDSKVFVVTRTALYKPEQDATDVFRSDDGVSHLNLITCQGSWNNSERTYSDRLVVFTDLVE